MRGRALRTGIAWDMRTGFKVKGRKLIQDGERPGIWTTRTNADQVHPQRFVHVPEPDGLHYRPGPPPQHSIGAFVDLTWIMASDTAIGTGGDTDQGTSFPGVLRKGVSPYMAIGLSEEGLTASQDGEFLPGSYFGPRYFGAHYYGSVTPDHDPADGAYSGPSYMGPRYWGGRYWGSGS